MTSPLRIGVLGAARIVPSALLAPARDRNDIRVTHVAARDPARAKAFAAEHGLWPAGTYAELLRRDDIDLVYIAVPPSGHCEWTLRAIDAGKAVLCEKPFAMNAAEASQMVEAATAARLPLIEAFHYRFHPAILRAQELLRTGAIGRIRQARASFATAIPQDAGEFRWRAELGGGAVMDLGCYPVHALRTLIGGEPTVLSAEALYEGDVEAEASAVLEFPGGATALIECGMRSAERKWDLEIHGEGGQMTLSNFIVPHYGSVLAVATAEGERAERFEGPSTYAAQLAHVAEVLLRGAPPMTGGEDSIANLRAIEAIRAAAGANAH